MARQRLQSTPIGSSMVLHIDLTSDGSAGGGEAATWYRRLCHEPSPKAKRSQWLAWVIEYSNGLLIEMRMEFRDRRCTIVTLCPLGDPGAFIDYWRAAARLEGIRLLDGEDCGAYREALEAREVAAQRLRQRQVLAKRAAERESEAAVTAAVVAS